MRNVLLVAFGAALGFGALSAHAADLAEGEKVFKKCRACHALEEGKKKVGPTLFGIVGAPAAGMKGFNYSAAMKNSGLTWDEATLDSYLENPRQFIKGNRMAFPGLKKPEDRANVIAYMKGYGR
ncbi:MAG: cytochrome c family protein [Alphaproteobacteria bacterium]